jgi:hypothetical protein
MTSPAARVLLVDDEKADSRARRACTVTTLYRIAGPR